MPYNMEENSNLFLGIKIPTQQLSSGLMQKVLIAVRKQGQTLQINRDLWNEMTKTFWLHLQTGLENFDDQLLCATCFYAVLTLSDEQEFYLNEISNKIKREIELKGNALKSRVNTLQAVSLMYGMFQSSYLTQNIRENGLDELLQVIFELLIVMAYEYSKYTFIVFKTISAFKKTCKTDLQEILFSNQNKLKLLNVVNHNWENPITGVRDINKTIFQTLISVMDDQMYDNILKEINEFYWNKAKYLMLSEIICQSNKNINLTEYDWINGLVNSLYKPGLVSAGADMYFSVLKKMKSEEQWCKMFMKPIVDLLCGASPKGIENFSNYWCITTFKKYPLVAEMILKELEDSNQENTLYSSLCIMKQANKLGLLKKNWDTTVSNYVECCILNALEHCDNQLRMMAFDVVCVSHCKSLPKEIEFKLVLNFLISNINSDCTVLRISMLKSFSSFLTQIHMSYLNYCNDGDDEMENLQYFCAHFQNFIINNIKLSGNYQRKITCVKLVHTFLNSLKEVPRKRLKQTRTSNKTLIQMLEDKGLWLMFEDNIIMSLLRHLKDPAQDVRDNAGLLLLEHYNTELTEKDLINLLIEDALKSISSKFFYEISCGQSMFKLIVNILIREKEIEAKFNTVDDVLHYALNEIIKEYQLNRGIVESIEKGKQLHSLISILHTVLEVCYERKNIINITKDQYNTLIEVLQGISNQFAWEKETSTSSDFSKMSDMVHSIIVTSGYDKKVDFDQTKISGLHQIVLSCLWLNVKASCELLSLLIKYQDDDIQIEIREKSLEIISHVLETCRHKGAIEATGAALGQSIQHLTSLPEDTALSKLPLSFLKTKLDELISEAARMASVTRRGAGLSIMVHRIVSNDAKRGKPLFHYFMKTILDTCNKAEFTPSTENMDNEKDLPKAIYIHFLTRIVTDSSLASDMMFYSAELAELAFGNLTSPYWQIRNAALQLYGALIQKLIGQKKASGAEEESVATVACDELRTHSPKLWQYIMNQLQNENFDDRVQYHSNLMPILNMLANIARRYSFSFDIVEHKKSHSGLVDSLMLLLDSPIFTVRRLSAKCIFNIFSNEEIANNLLMQDYSTENYLHGSLLLIANMLNSHGSKDINQTMINKLKEKYADILNAREHSYLCREIFDDIFFDKSFVVYSVQQTLVELRTKSQMPGVFLWANKRLQKYLYYVSWNKVHDIILIILKQNESESYLSTLYDKIENDKNISQKALLDIANVLISSGNKYNSFIIWKILYEILQKIDQTSLIVELIDLSEIFIHLKERGVPYKLRYMIPFAARLLALGAENKKLADISSITNRLTDPETTDVEMRLIAAMANNELCLDIKNLPEPVKITVVKSAVILLQDEDEDIRMMCAKFYPIAIHDVKKSLQPYICLSKLLDHKFLYSIFSKNAVCTLKKELMEYLTKVCSKHVDEYNPFANDSTNIYLEVDVFRQIIENL